MKKLSLIFTDIRFSKIFLLGIISGMPFSILYTTIIAWLNHFDLNFAVVTQLAVARMPYSMKFLWSPAIDYFHIPFLTKYLGRRRSWMFLTSIGIASILYYLSFITPSDYAFNKILLLSTVIGFLAATYDIAYDALRIEILEPEMQALAVAHVTLAYRIGIILTGACAISAGQLQGWKFTFQTMSWLFILGALLSLAIPTSLENVKRSGGFFSETFKSFKDLFKRKHILLILSTIILYKLGDAMLAFVGMKFYVVAGFTLVQISLVVKTFGLIATILGSYIGGMIMIRFGSLSGLMICGAAQMVTNLGYIWLNHAHKNIGVFLITNICENFTGGMGAGALSGYISILCSIKFAANQFALLSSCSAFMNSFLTAFAGKLVQIMGWDNYFVFTALISTPALVLIYILDKKIKADAIEKDNSRK